MTSLPGWEVVSRRHPVVVYAIARFVLLVLVLAVLSVARLSGLPLVVAGLLVSAVLSYLFLRPLRDRVAASVEQRAVRGRERVVAAPARPRARSWRRLDAGAASEDDD